MRCQLSKQEPARLKAWVEGKLYEEARKARRTARAFHFHDGPPYANGHIHMGTALNKILKDIVVRYKLLRGFDAPYVHGWDCHGLPIELKALENDPSIAAAARSGNDPETKLRVRKACRAYAEKYLDVQRGEFRRLGVLGDLDRPYITMDPAYQADILEGLARLVEEGYVRRAEKPVLWCAKCRTALADAEVEYEESTSPAITVKFPLESDPKSYLLIWTTTPWTLPANLAVAVKPDATYLRAKVGEEVWIAAETRAASSGVPAGAPAERVPGKDLVGLVYRHPFAGRTGKVYPAGFVTMDTGTGLVHIAPGHGEEDFQLGQKYQIPTLSPVDGAGRFTRDGGEFAGQFVFDANPHVVDRLRLAGALVKSEEILHTYPHCWRCKKPVIFRATPQWFVSVDHQGLRKKMLDAIGQVRWVPAVGENRIRGMVESRPDWCISRQRIWGVPIPAVHCRSCGCAHLDASIVRRVSQAVRARSADVWFSEPPASFLPPGWSCPSCGSADFKREEDILDVWFDSGMSHIAAFERRHETWPADLYLEGSDQHRGWFQVSLLLGVALKGRPPFRQVLTHGFICDAGGRKMSKSLGNAVAPQEVVDKHGADVLRLWVAGSDYTSDIRIGETILSETVDTYRRIRNTIRFLLGNLHDFDPGAAVAFDEMDALDRFMLQRMSRLAAETLEAYDAYDFSTVVRRVRDFCSEDLSGFYLDVLKDRLYCDARDGRSRRSGQTVLHHLAEQVLFLISPILPFTADEAWEAMPYRPGSRESRPAIPEYRPLHVPLAMSDSPAQQVFEQVLRLRKEVNGTIEKVRQAGQIGSSLEAQVSIRASGAEYAQLSSVADRLAEWFIVSACKLEESPAGPREIRVDRAAGEKCDRCWKYVPVRHPVDQGAVCPRCADVLRGLALSSRS